LIFHDANSAGNFFEASMAVDLGEMQTEYVAQVEQLRSDDGFIDDDFDNPSDLNSQPGNASPAELLAYATDLQNLYGQAYQDRVDAVYTDYGLSHGGNVDTQAKISLTDQVRQSFGETSVIAAPIKTSGPLDFSSSDQASVGIHGSVAGDAANVGASIASGAATAASAIASGSAGAIKAAFSAAPLTMAIVAAVVLGGLYFVFREEI